MTTLLLTKSSTIRCRQSTVCQVISCLKYDCSMCGCWAMSDYVQVCVVPFVILSKLRKWQTYKKSKSALNSASNLGEKAMETFKMMKDVAELLFSKPKSWKPGSPLSNKTHENVKYENVDWTKKPFLITTRISVCKVTNMLGISLGPVKSILKGNLNMCQIAAILPCLQSEIHLLVNFCLKN